MLFDRVVDLRVDLRAALQYGLARYTILGVTLVRFAAFVLVVWALAREAACWVVKILLVVGLALGVALWAGWLNHSEVARWLERIGDWLIAGLRAVTHWLVEAWTQVSSP